MWVFIAGGFVSIVAHRKRPGQVLVRARRRADLERFLCPPGTSRSLTDEIDATPTADYPFRVVRSKKSLAVLMAAHAAAIDYDNFKAAPDNADRQHMLHDVWNDVKQLESSIAINGHHVWP